MRFSNWALCGALCAAGAAGQTVAPTPDKPGGSAAGEHPATAVSHVKDAKGAKVGTATFVETPRGVLLRLEAQGLRAGELGFHLHETGKCEGPKFESAGGHFNPSKKSHGFHNTAGQHQGDMANLIVDASGRIKTERYLEGLKLRDLMDADGTALVIHGGVDDYRTDPAGNAGERIACGVVGTK